MKKKLGKITFFSATRGGGGGAEEEEEEEEEKGGICGEFPNSANVRDQGSNIRGTSEECQRNVHG